MQVNSEKEPDLEIAEHENWQRKPALFTFYYICVSAPLFYILFQEGYIERVEDFGLNAFGDFLAGYFSPIGIIWIVAGFLQQGRDFKTSIIEQSKAAQAALENIEVQKLALDQKLYPNISLFNPRLSENSATERRSSDLTLDVFNAGAAAFDVQIYEFDPLEDSAREFHKKIDTKFYLSTATSFSAVPLKAYSHQSDFPLFPSNRRDTHTLQINVTDIEDLETFMREAKSFERTIKLRVRFFDSLRRVYDQIWTITIDRSGNLALDKVG